MIELPKDDFSWRVTSMSETIVDSGTALFTDRCGSRFCPLCNRMSLSRIIYSIEMVIIKILNVIDSEKRPHEDS